ncbi:MAG: pentapeptide repeat-containing protein [Minicystis sp.]
MRNRSDRPAPAAFGPISAAWAPRAGKLGKAYGKNHRQRAPAFADDFDWSYFQAAPADQQLRGYLRGDEELIFQNLHPTTQVLTTRLPGLRIRVFVKDRAGVLREAPMSLDTLFADLDRETVTLTWRGLVPVKEADLDDVETVLLASEKLGERPLPEDHYRAEVARFEADPLRVRESMPEGLRDIAEQAVYHRRLFAPGSEGTVGDDPLTAAVRGKIGHLPPAEQQHILEGIGRLVAAPMPPGVDLRQQIERAIAEMEPPPAVPAAPPQPGVFPIRDARIGRSVAKVRALVDQLKAEGKRKGIELKGVEKYERILEDLRSLALPGDEAAAAQKPPEEPGPGRDLSNQDLSGRDLRGCDLRGAKLDRTILARADLREAKLAGASLREAVLSDADLTGADLSQTDLYRTNLGGARAAGATLRGARMNQTILDRADLTGATLAEVEGEMAIVAEANLTRADLRRAHFHKSLFREVTLAHADLSGASLVRCAFLKCNAPEARFDGATLTKASFTESDLHHASFVGARGERSSFLRATIDDADFGQAMLARAVLREVKATRTRFHGTNLREAHLYRAQLDHVDMTRANLANAILTRATLSRVLFSGANLYAADFTQAAGTNNDFTGANLTRCTLENV